jgi:hypothetical protein
MDKGYDSEKLHALIRKEIKAESIIPLRGRKRKKIKEKYRKQQYLTFVWDNYYRDCINTRVIYFETGSLVILLSKN